MKIIDYFRKENREERNRERLKSRAEELFDVTLYESDLWLCYRGELIAPMSILTEKTDVSECMSLVSVMRTLYIERNL